MNKEPSKPFTYLSVNKRTLGGFAKMPLSSTDIAAQALIELKYKGSTGNTNVSKDSVLKPHNR